jgi:predicted nucleic acid-binding protein
VRKFVLDTNLYVRAIRSRAGALELEQFYSVFTPATYLSSIVLHELLVGASTPVKARQVEEELARPLKSTGRIITPTHAAWESAGEVLSEMARDGKLDLRSMPKSLVNDVLLAASCREAGVTLITENVRDFERICHYIRLEYIEPWPS